MTQWAINQKIEIQILKDAEGARIDVALSSYLPEKSRSFIQKLIEEGNVTVDGKPCTTKKEKLKQGQTICIVIPPPVNMEVCGEDIELDIVYEDDDVLLINKGKGMVVHPAAGNQTGTLVNAVIHHCGDSLSSINGVIRPGIVHRIDKDTTGLLVIAKNDFAHNSLAKQLEEHTITRRYRAVVYNNFANEEGTVDAPIGRNKSDRQKQRVMPYENDKVPQGARRAVTHYKVLEKFGKYTYIEARLETGRTHQIRVHMAYIKHPLLGDETYGPKKKYPNLTGQALHAAILGFVHPRTGEYMEFEAPLPAEFEQLLSKLRKERG